MTLIVDAHVHVYRSREEGRRAQDGYEIWEYGSGGNPVFADWDGDANDAVTAMERAGARHVVVTHMLDPVPENVDRGEALIAFNEWLVALAARDSRFVPCLAVDPGCLPVPELAAHVRQLAVERGAAGIKLHPPVHRLNVRDESLWPIFEVCQELGLRVVSHSGPSRSGTQYGEPDAFRRLLDAFPRLRISLAHLGGATWRQIPQLAADYPQVYFDCCEIIEWIGAARAPTREQFVALLREVGTDRVMMGSDFPWYDIAHTVELVRGLGLTPAETDAVLGGNATRFFDLPAGSQSD